LPICTCTIAAYSYRRYGRANTVTAAAATSTPPSPWLSHRHRSDGRTWQRPHQVATPTSRRRRSHRHRGGGPTVIAATATPTSRWWPHQHHHRGRGSTNTAIAAAAPPSSRRWPDQHRGDGLTNIAIAATASPTPPSGGSPTVIAATATPTSRRWPHQHRHHGDGHTNIAATASPTPPSRRRSHRIVAAVSPSSRWRQRQHHHRSHGRLPLCTFTIAAYSFACFPLSPLAPLPIPNLGISHRGGGHTNPMPLAKRTCQCRQRPDTANAASRVHLQALPMLLAKHTHQRRWQSAPADTANTASGGELIAHFLPLPLATNSCFSLTLCQPPNRRVRVWRLAPLTVYHIFEL
jgi:hypothetical protein